VDPNFNTITHITALDPKNYNLRPIGSDYSALPTNGIGRWRKYATYLNGNGTSWLTAGQGRAGHPPSDFTIVAWVKPEPNQPSGTGVIVSTIDNANLELWCANNVFAGFALLAAAGPSFQFQTGDRSSFNTLSTPGTYPSNEWLQVVATFTSTASAGGDPMLVKNEWGGQMWMKTGGIWTGTKTLYVNGQPVASITANFFQASTFTYLAVGSHDRMASGGYNSAYHTYTGVNPYNGAIDEIMVFHRAWSEDEVRGNYKMGTQ
jgi:hypothetical protein